MVRAKEPGLPVTDMSGSEIEVGAPTSEEEAERKKSRTKRAPKSPLTAVLESWLLSILHCRFSVISVAHFLVCFQLMPKRFREFPETKMYLPEWRLMGS